MSGREMLNILAEREFPADEVFAIASRRIDGRRGFLRRSARSNAATSRISTSAASTSRLMSAGSAVSKEWSPTDRRAGLRRHRQFLLLALRPRRSADRAGSERRRRGGLHQEEHHRQSELLDRAARRGAEAAARSSPRSSAWSSPPISRCPAPARRRWTSCATRPSGIFVTDRDRAQDLHQADRLQRHSRISTSSWRTARPRRSGR